MRMKISSSEYTVKRINVRGNARTFVWEKGKQGFRANIEWKGSYEKTRPYIEKKLFIYRSSYVVSYSGKTGAEYRVWVHTDRPDVTESQLQNKMQELFNLYPTNINVWEEAYPEDNEPMHEDEIRPAGAELGEWFGYVNFNKGGGSSSEYYARGTVTLSEMR